MSEQYERMNTDVANGMLDENNALRRELDALRTQRDELVKALERWCAMNTRDVGESCDCESCSHYDYCIELLTRIKEQP